MGDSILTTPLIKALKKKNQDSRIVFCVRPENSGLFEGVSFIDEVITFDKRGGESGLAGLLSFAKKIRLMQFDMVISPHMSFRSSMALAFSRIPEKIGFVESALSMVYTMSRAKDLTYHEADRNLLLYERIFGEFPDEKISPEVYIDQKLAEEYRRSLGDNLIGINPGSVWNTKKWAAENFAHVADRLKEKGFNPVIIGSDADRAEVERLVASAQYPHINMCGKTALRELPALISTFRYLITNDSGPMHIAVSAGVPSVAIFGPTTRELGFYPYDEVSKVAELEGLSCRPCGRHGGDKCPEKHFKCMTDITPENVLSLFAAVSAPKEERKPKYVTEKA
jgi:heptosyltransferase-2